MTADDTSPMALDMVASRPGETEAVRVVGKVVGRQSTSKRKACQTQVSVGPHKARHNGRYGGSWSRGAQLSRSVSWGDEGPNAAQRTRTMLQILPTAPHARGRRNHDHEQQRPLRQPPIVLWMLLLQWPLRANEASTLRH
jgi:hypothetical protein